MVNETQPPTDGSAEYIVIYGTPGVMLSAFKRFVAASECALVQWREPHGEDSYHQHAFEQAIREARAKLDRIASLEARRSSCINARRATSG